MSKNPITRSSKVQKLFSQIKILQGELQIEPDDNKEMRLRTLKRRLKTAKKSLKTFGNVYA
jgi:hypothetical protein